MLRTKDILDEKDKRLRLVSEEVTFPLAKEDREKIQSMIEYLTSILTPIYAILLICPINYYITKFIYKKWAK